MNATMSVSSHERELAAVSPDVIGINFGSREGIP